MAGEEYFEGETNFSVGGCIYSPPLIEPLQWQPLVEETVEAEQWPVVEVSRHEFVELVAQYEILEAVRRILASDDLMLDSDDLLDVVRTLVTIPADADS